jgi:ketopantoate reductase
MACSPRMPSDIAIDEDTPRRVVIGEGRIGTALARASGCAVVSRYRGWYVLEEPAGDPIVVCVRNDDLGGVLTQVPQHRWPDLVFVQNGMIDAWLADHGLAGNTRGVLFFAVPARGAPVQPGGISRFTGPHANALALWLESLGLRAEVLGRRSFSAAMLEKLIWNAAFGVLCVRHEATVGQILSDHQDELAALARELNAVGRAALTIDLDDAALLRGLREYAGTIPEHRAALSEWRWRGGWFVDAAQQHGVPTPTHDALLDALPRAPAAAP